MRRESGDLIHQLPIRLPSLFISFPFFNTRLWEHVKICYWHIQDTWVTLFFTCSFNFMGVRLGVHLLLRKHCPIEYYCLFRSSPIFINIHSFYYFKQFLFKGLKS